MFHIVFNTDEGYLRYAAVLATSIVKNTNSNKKFEEFFKQNGCSCEIEKYTKLHYNSLNEEDKEEGYVFHLLIDNISQENQKKIEQLEQSLNDCYSYPCKFVIHLIDDKFFKDCSRTGPAINNLATYYRLRIASILSDIKTCLYLDVDMLVSCDIRELFTIDLQEKIGGVVYYTNDITIHFDPIKKDKERLVYMGKYFNSGFMLMNLEQWRKKQIEEICFNFIKNYYLSTSPDEFVLNVAINHENFIEIPLEYNFAIMFNYIGSIAFTTISVDRAKQAYKNIKIAHLTGMGLIVKPWVSFYASLVVNCQPLHYEYYDKWWFEALETPIFNKELQKIYNEITNNALEIYSKTIGNKIQQLENRIVAFETNNYERSVESIKKEVKEHLSYKLGQTLIKAYNNRWGGGLIKMPFELLTVIKNHKNK
ncbi:hypothetical protein DMB95_09400, partial [Campylobacter sp. MIT 12-8780]|uniref:glycosyltransferase family 8 protein n=1 Tax=Campylobacter sp. MIT 12-8780 TaxID=2202200 RepID=UPI00115F6911